jgi:uncharacterized membrane protein YphA (DoxX/SURF4 family)
MSDTTQSTTTKLTTGWWAAFVRNWSTNRWCIAWRAWIILWLAVTYYKTELTWQNRQSPPQLSAWGIFDWLQFDYYLPLLGTLFAVLIVPRTGLVLHSVLLFIAILADQTRLQPEFISSVILLWASFASPALRTVGALHLGTMWFYAGLHKILAPGFYRNTSLYIFQQLMQLDISETQTMSLGIALAVAEMSLGLLVILPRTRRIAAVLACGMHLVIFVCTTTLPMSVNHWIKGDQRLAEHYLYPSAWFQPIWPWNLILMLSGFALLWNWNSTPRQLWQQAHAGLRTAILAMLVSPLLYYVGWLHPYLAHCLYSGNVVVAYVEYQPTSLPIPEQADPRKVGLRRGLGEEVQAALGLSLPPTEFMFRRYFEMTGRPGEVAVLMYPPALSLVSGIKERVIYHRRGELINGQKQGHWIEYDPDGLPWNGNYIDGLKTGIWIFEDSDHSRYQVEFRAGEMIPGTQQRAKR